jgi:hypothetical protein
MTHTQIHLKSIWYIHVYSYTVLRDNTYYLNYFRENRQWSISFDDYVSDRQDYKGLNVISARGSMGEHHYHYPQEIILYDFMPVIYTVRQKLSTTWLVSIIFFLIMYLFQIGLLFSLPVHTYLLTCESGYWPIFIYVYMTGCVKCHVYFSTFVFANESWFFY